MTQSIEEIVNEPSERVLDAVKLLVDQIVLVEFYGDRESVEGKLIATVQRNALIEVIAGKAEMVDLAKVYHIKRADRPDPVVKWGPDVVLSNVRQHLMDRHGTPVTETVLLSDEQGLVIHANYHAKLKDEAPHQHGVRPRPPRPESMAP